jgi:deoxycytidylate deaminase
MGTHGGCTRTVHAEANAIAFAARFGTSIDGSELYCTHSPCLPCAKLVVNAGIVRYVYEQPYRDTSGLSLLEEAGILVVQHVAPEVEPRLTAEEFGQLYMNDPQGLPPTGDVHIGDWSIRG